MGTIWGVVRGPAETGAAAALLAALVIGSCAGCADPQPGRPVAAAAPGSRTTGAPTETATGKPSGTERPTGTPARPAGSGAPPPRPKPLDMGPVDPCVLLRDMHTEKVGINLDHGTLPDRSYVFPGARNCFGTDSRTRMGVGVVPVPNKGFDAYLDGILADVTLTESAGYRLAIVRAPPYPESCAVVADVDDGQLLHISVLGYEKQGLTQDQLCALLPRLAEAALRVLAG